VQAYPGKYTLLDEPPPLVSAFTTTELQPFQSAVVPTQQYSGIGSFAVVITSTGPMQPGIAGLAPTAVEVSLSLSVYNSSGNLLSLPQDVNTSYYGGAEFHPDGPPLSQPGDTVSFTDFDGVGTLMTGDGYAEFGGTITNYGEHPVKVSVGIYEGEGI
jgi:hypothetical protein